MAELLVSFGLMSGHPPGPGIKRSVRCSGADRSKGGHRYGQGTREAEEWVRPLLHCLDRRNAGALDVIETLEALHDTLEKRTRHQQDAVKPEVAYFRQNKDRMDYKKGKSLGQPIGSGKETRLSLPWPRFTAINGGINSFPTTFHNRSVWVCQGCINKAGLRWNPPRAPPDVSDSEQGARWLRGAAFR